MNTKRDYPLFLIDRSKAEAYPFDYVVCVDKTVGFVARIVHWTTDQFYNEFMERQRQIPNGDWFVASFKLKAGAVVMVIEEFIHNPELTQQELGRIKTLMKKALKKYLHTEVERTPDMTDELSIENQITQQRLTVERAKQNYSVLLSRANGSKEVADYQIALAEATLTTLESYRDNMEYFKLNMK